MSVVIVISVKEINIFSYFIYYSIIIDIIGNISIIIITITIDMIILIIIIIILIW